MNETVKILKIKISNVDYEDALEEVKKWLKNGVKKHYIVTPNPEILIAAQKNERLAEILNRADLALPDGMGLLWAAKILGKPLKKRVTGTDFMEKLCEWAAKEGLKVGLLGGKSGVAARAAECLRKRYPQLKVVLAQEEWSDAYIDGSCRLAAPRVSHFIDILFVAFGAPKQEIWIGENLEKLPVKVTMGVGGAFDFLAGVTPRAPKGVGNLGLEWLYRLICQPWRIRRQLALLKFIFLVLNERFMS